MNLSTLTAAVVLFIIASAIVMSDQMNDWGLFLPSLLIGLGAYILIIGLWKKVISTDRVASDDGKFKIFWGDLILTLGVLVLSEQLAVARAHEAFEGESALKDAKQQASLAAVCARLADVTLRLSR